jgi:hypothetical protein
MELPQSCPCELAGGYDIPLPCFAGHGIPKRCKEFDECVEKGTKPDWCPFVCSIPEGHGRLVDADEFLKRAIGTKCFDEDDSRMLTELVGESITIVPKEAERSKT